MSATREKEAAEAERHCSRLRLSPRSLRYAAALFEELNDWDVVRMLAVVPWPLAYEDVVKAMDSEAEGIDGFVILSDAAPIGAASVKRPGSGDPPRTMPRLGFWIGRRHWGQGFGTEAVGLLVDHAFRTNPGDTIGAGVFHDNPASRRTLEKHGFAESGRYPVACHARGEEVETINMLLARAAWEEVRR
jgi:RimJ/RimL family protein N-acetyltransferase